MMAQRVAIPMRMARVTPPLLQDKTVSSLRWKPMANETKLTGKLSSSVKLPPARVSMTLCPTKARSCPVFSFHLKSPRLPRLPPRLVTLSSPSPEAIPRSLAYPLVWELCRLPGLRQSLSSGPVRLRTCSSAKMLPRSVVSLSGLATLSAMCQCLSKIARRMYMGSNSI